MSGSEHNIALTTDLFLHGLVLFTFLTAFFLFYVGKLTINVLQKQLSRTIDKDLGKVIRENIQNVKNAKNNDAMSVFTFDAIPYDKLKKYFNKPDPIQTTNNEWLKKMLISINILLFAFFIIAVFLIKMICKIDLDIKEILTLNAVTFIGIGIVEYIFFTNIVLKFIPTPPSLIIDTMIETTKKHF